MGSSIRFRDENKTALDFQSDVIVVCPKCSEKAFAKVNDPEKKVRLFCDNCGYNKEISTIVFFYGVTGNWQFAAHVYFKAELWLKIPFKDDEIFAYNYEHLDYLERYVTANLREHKDRTHFTLLEKLPKFYHEAKNRKTLLKLIRKLKNK
ncbi:hypothetical protein D1632_13880 [Chryseobacterium nematophagum]|uniref:TFIIB-type zinc ribbon-containing protein n=1 Tax=Chryseobacterium nematophagum TaxID=2305228 RepID=A0A3M7L8Y5_9FLAO|nr:hypothetical protein [Chryseobacterium nematophagum]RMZ58679.1 hypothetical protein D1632_13880 [Chryseobacterium nematophagum]